MFRRAMTRSTFTRCSGIAVQRGDRAREAFLEIDRRAPAERLLRLAHVGPGIADVARARIAVLALDRLVEDPADRVRERVDAGRSAGGDVEDAPVRALRLAGADRRVDDVV